MPTFTPRTLTTAEFNSLPPTLTTGGVSSAAPIVTQILNTAQMLSASGYGTPGPLDQIRTLHDAARAAVAAAHTNDPFAGLDPATIDPSDAVRMIREHATSRVLIAAPGSMGSNGLATAMDQFIASLTPAAVEAFAEYLTTSVAVTLNREFSKAAAKVDKAVKAGLTSSSTAVELINNGTPEQVTAYRELMSATRDLDRLCALWSPAIRTLDPGADTATVVGAFISTDNEAERENAAGVFAGDAETVLVASDHASIGPSVHKVTRPRFGGAWLALVAAGYKLTLRVPPPAIEADDTLADTA